MTELIVDADVLASARFGTSQLTETVAALRILIGPDVEPWFRGWYGEHLPLLRERLAQDPVEAALVVNAFRPGWVADFLTMPPLAPDQELEDELATMVALGDDRVRSDLAFVRSPLLPALAVDYLAERAAEFLRWVWTTTVLPTWPRRLRVLRADVVSRTSRLSEQGWSGVLEGLGQHVRWLGDGRIQVNDYTYPPLDVRGGDLMFIAAHRKGVGLAWRRPDRYAVSYPVTGIFAETEPLADPLVRLLGRTRARILAEAAEPISTTALVATTGLSLGTVADHLRVLADAGLLEHRRSGRQVLYWQSETGRRVANGL